MSLSTYAQDYTTWSLPDGAMARLGKGEITGNIAFSPDGNRLAVASSIGIWIYDVRPGKEKELNLLPINKGWVTSVAFSPNGSTIASGCTDGTVRLWDGVTGHHRTTLGGDGNGITTVAFSPDGNTIASGSYDHIIQQWDTQTGQLKSTLYGHTDIVNYVVYSSDGKTIASTSQDKTVRLWDTHTYKDKKTLTGHTNPVTAIDYSPFSRWHNHCYSKHRPYNTIVGCPYSPIQKYTHRTCGCCYGCRIFTRWKYNCKCKCRQYSTIVGFQNS